MKLKLDENGYAVLHDGKPVYVHEDGKEVPFDAAAAMEKIGSLNAEAKRHREAKDAAESRLKAFEGIEDAAAAKKALATVRNFDDKKLIDAGEAERVKAGSGQRKKTLKKNGCAKMPGFFALGRGGGCHRFDTLS
ncbi:hypothetical protein [Neisseria leonii]|uniref:hypothetical protein n=1 Tax=Neisseria leonii TaxID=2995413 RepID=UPI00237B638B|nr:hypothetical protein [Neisseria sp. 3986]MDD9325205.1 hypothetical protein [Neisseria sp. 3986]